MIQHPDIHALTAGYVTLPMTLLRITAEMRTGAHIARYDPVMFDGLLAAAVVRDATHGQGLPKTGDPYDIPLPLKCLWRSPEGLPLWAASCLWPREPHFADVIYLHKRAQTGEFTAGRNGRYSIQVSTGRWMERRVPTPTTLAAQGDAYAIGNADELQRLLNMISHIGKRRGAGLGEVRAWHIEECDGIMADFGVHCVVIRDGVLSRPVPAGAVGALGLHDLIDEPPSLLCGWTPPYWFGATMSPGWRAGTPLVGIESGNAMEAVQ